MREFYKNLLKHPAQMGAIFPSSPRLANTIAKQLPEVNEDYVLELGPGTGVVTKAMIKRGISAEKIIAIEKSPTLAESLQKKFTTLRVVTGDARQLSTIAKTLDHPVKAIVSSLPLLSLKPLTVRSILSEADKVLKEGGVFIQFTYGKHDICSKYFKQLKYVYSKKVWLNIPPATIYVYKK